MTAIVAEAIVACRSDAARLWAAITDTERLNRAMGMRRLRVRPLSGVSSARFLVSTRLGGLPVEYEERPFEWLYPRRFQILRRMRSGPVLSLELAYELDRREGEGTDVKIRLTLEPRYRILSPFVRFMSRLSVRDIAKAIARMDASLQQATGLLPSHATTSTEHLERAQALLREAVPERGPLVDRLIAYVRKADDVDVSRIRPFALADEWGENRVDVISVCLSAVRAGLLELRWEVVCPSCRTATDELPSLASLSEHGSCQLCDLQFVVDLEDVVEATFAPARAVRAVDVGPYCIGGPARTPHVLAQAILPAKGEATIVCPTDEGRYRLFVRGGPSRMIDVAGRGPRELRVTAEPARAGAYVVAPGGSIVVESASAEERHVKLERLVFSDKAARARVITALPAFRRDFAHDVLRPGIALKVARVCLFFSDLTGSTTLYSHVGDAVAFRLVHDHFDLVIGVLEKNHGTVIKTMGDAVMAVFADDVDALLAAIALLHAIDAFRGADDERTAIRLKIGLFAGPCYVVTANGILDYFGQTVNLAARLQGEARSGDLIVEAELADRAIAKKVLPEACVVERYDAKLKGVAAPVPVARIRVTP